MIDLLTGIQTKWLATSALTDLIPNLYLGLAPDNQALPTARIVSVSGSAEYGTSNGTKRPAIEKYLFQIDVFANADVFVANTLEAIDAAYNFKPLSLANDYFMAGIRQGVPVLMREDMTTWHGYIVFEFTTVKAI